MSKRQKYTSLGLAVFLALSTNVADAVCSCSKSYAGKYEVVTNNLPLGLRQGHSSTSLKLGTIPKGAIIYVSEGNGTWAHVTYKGVSGHIAMQYLKKVESTNTSTTSSNSSVPSSTNSNTANIGVTSTNSNVTTTVTNTSSTISSNTTNIGVTSTNNSATTVTNTSSTISSNTNNIGVNSTSNSSTSSNNTPTQNKVERHNFIFGDVDGNGIVNDTDYKIISDFLNSPKILSTNKELDQRNFDINNDGKITDEDYRYFYDWYLGSRIKGDVYTDKAINERDYDTLYQCLVKDKTAPPNVYNADLNNDYKVDEQDLKLLHDMLFQKAGTSNLKGDVDGNGIVNEEDSQRLSSYLVNPEHFKLTKEINESNSDINSDGKIDQVDLEYLSDWVYGSKIKGDANNDNVVNEKDYDRLSDYLTTNNYSSPNRYNSDLNNDYKVDEQDIKLLHDKILVKAGNSNLKGDVDGNGVVNEEDSKYLFSYIGNPELFKKTREINESNSDINSDGKINYDDLNYLKDWVSGSKIKGDADNDNAVNMRDYDRLYEHLTTHKYSSPNLYNSDLNNDYKLTYDDLNLLKQKLIGNYKTVLKLVAGSPLKNYIDIYEEPFDGAKHPTVDINSLTKSTYSSYFSDIEVYDNGFSKVKYITSDQKVHFGYIKTNNLFSDEDYSALSTMPKQSAQKDYKVYTDSSCVNSVGTISVGAKYIALSKNGYTQQIIYNIRPDAMYLGWISTVITNNVPDKVVVKPTTAVYPKEGLYSFQPKCAPNNELTVLGGSTQGGTEVISYSINSQNHTNILSHQKWRITRINQNSPWYKIEVENSNNSLNVHNGIAQNGAHISIWPYSGFTNEFKFIEGGNGYYKIVANVGNGTKDYVIGVDSNSARLSANIILWEAADNNDGQLWKLVERTPGNPPKAQTTNSPYTVISIDSEPSTVPSVAPVTPKPPIPTPTPSQTIDNCTCYENVNSTYVVATNSANLALRKSHSANSVQLASIPKGTKLFITKMGSEWAHTSFNGKSGYVHSSYLKKETSGPVLIDECICSTNAAGYYIASGGEVPIRGFHSSNSSALLINIPKGATVYASKGNNQWLHITYNNCSGIVDANLMLSKKIEDEVVAERKKCHDELFNIMRTRNNELRDACIEALGAIGEFYDINTNELQSSVLDVFAAATDLIVAELQYKNGNSTKANIRNAARSVIEKCAATAPKIAKAYFEIKQKNSKKTDRVSNGFDILSNVVSIATSLATTCEGIEEGDYSGIVDGIVATGTNTTKVAQNIMKLSSIGQHPSKIKMGSKVFTKSDVCCAAIISTLEGVGQTVKSVKEYSKDGSYTSKDLGHTMLDVAGSMTNSLIHTFTLGLDRLVYQAISNGTNGKVDPEGNFGILMADTLKGFSNGLHNIIYK